MTMEQLLTEDEVAEAFGVTRATLWKYRREGLLRFVRLGRFIRYRAEDVEAFLEERQGLWVAPPPNPIANRKKWAAPPGWTAEGR
jgi:excisionase family DNA binding protein